MQVKQFSICLPMQSFVKLVIISKHLNYKVNYSVYQIIIKIIGLN